MNLTKKKIRYFLGLLLGYLIYLSGAVARAEKRLIKNKGILPVYFHNPDKDIFLKLIKWFIKRQYVFVSLDNISLELEKDNSAKKLCISFDDGWKGNYTEILPILIQFSIPASFFFSINCIEDGFFWFSLVRNQRAVLGYSVNKLWQIPNKERIQKVKQLIEKNDIPLNSETITIEHLKDLASYPQFTIGNHTYSHAILINCDENDLDQEISEANKILEQYTGRNVNVFAYPDGRYNPEVNKYLEKQQFKYAFTTHPGMITTKSDNLMMPRNSVPNSSSFIENLCHAFGVWQMPIISLKKIFGKGLKNY